MSNAFMKSMNTVSTCPPMSIISVHISRTFSNWVAVDRPLINPYCFGLSKFFFLMWSTILDLISDSITLYGTLASTSWQISSPGSGQTDNLFTSYFAPYWYRMKSLNSMAITKRCTAIFSVHFSKSLGNSHFSANSLLIVHTLWSLAAICTAVPVVLMT